MFGVTSLSRLTAGGHVIRGRAGSLPGESVAGHEPIKVMLWAPDFAVATRLPTRSEDGRRECRDDREEGAVFPGSICMDYKHRRVQGVLAPSYCRALFSSAVWRAVSHGGDWQKTHGSTAYTYIHIPFRQSRMTLKTTVHCPLLKRRCRLPASAVGPDSRGAVKPTRRHLCRRRVPAHLAADVLLCHSPWPGVSGSDWESGAATTSRRRRRAAGLWATAAGGPSCRISGPRRWKRSEKLGQRGWERTCGKTLLCAWATCARLVRILIVWFIWKALFIWHRAPADAGRRYIADGGAQFASRWLSGYGRLRKVT